MRRTIVVLAALAALVTMAVPAHAATQYKTTLSGSAEVGGGDADGSGVAKVTFKQNGDLCFNVRVSRIGEVTAAHIHRAAVGKNGPVVVNFDVPVNGLKGCVAVSPKLAAKLKRHPSTYYVNVHTAGFPAGAVRGQLG